MNPHPVAPTPKELAPPRVAVPSPTVANAFDQLLSIGLASPPPQSKPAGASETTPPAARPKSKDDANDTNAAAAAVVLPAPQTLPAITAMTASGQVQVAVPTAPKPQVPGLVAAGAPTTPDAAATGANTAGATLPPGAAALEARIVAAAPTFVSQPSTALGGLWHHLGANALSPNAAGQPGATAKAADDPSLAGGAAAQAPADAASLPKGVPLEPHADPVNSPAETHAADIEKPTVATGTGDASRAATVALPGPTDAPLAAPQAASAAPAPAAPAPIPAAWDQVAINLARAAQGGTTDRIEIQLKPASLGAIAVKLDLTHDGHISAVISADRSDTLNLLRQHADTLAQSLRDAGLQADSGSLSFNLRGDAQSFTPAPTPTVARADRGEQSAPAPSTSIDLSRYRQHAGALDIEV
jgi:flagellar hook-length control protein FliK